MFDAYKVAVKLTLVNHVSTGLAAITSQLGQVNRGFAGAQSSAALLEKKLLDIKRLALVGGGLAAVGFGGLALFKAPLEEAKKFQTEVAKFSALGLGDKVTGDAVRFAKSMDVMGQSARDNMKLLREATAIMGDFGHAREVLPLMARMKFGLESVMGEGNGSQFEQMFQAALKTTELRGALVNRETGHIDLSRFSAALNMMTQAYVASGGLVKPQDYLAAIKTGGVSTKLMSDEMFYFGLGHFMQESGGSRTGTASMSMFQNLAMGRVSKMVAKNLADIGIIKESDIRFGMGPLASVNPMAIKNAQGFTENPFKWVNETMVPALQAKGFHGNDLNVKLAQMFGIRTASNLADQFVRDQKIADLYVERSKKAANVDQLYRIGSGTMQGKEVDLHAKWKDALRELGEVALPMAIKAVDGLATALKSFNQFAKENHGTVKFLTYAFIGLSGAMAIGGTVLLMTSGFKGLKLALELLGAPGGSIATATKGIGLFGKALGALGAIATAWATGQAVGGFIYDHLSDGSKNSIGRGVATVLALFGNKEARAALDADGGSGFGPKNTFLTDERMAKADAAMRRYGMAPPPAPKTVQVHTEVNMDGFRVANIISKHQEKALSRPQSGMSTFDGTMNLRMLGSGFAGG